MNPCWFSGGALRDKYRLTFLKVKKFNVYVYYNERKKLTQKSISEDILKGKELIFNGTLKSNKNFDRSAQLQHCLTLALFEITTH